MHVHPLAIIPLRKDNSSNSSRNSSRNRSRSPDHTSKTQVPVRALIPRPSVHQQGGGVAGGSGATEAARSDDDNALMKGLISLLPHEQADSQFRVTSPVRPPDGGDGSRNEPWFRAHPSSSNGGDGSSSSAGSGSSFGGSCTGGDRARRRGRPGGSAATPFATGGGGGLADYAGLDFLGTTDSVRDLLHLPYTSEAVTVGLHRVGQTLVLDGNLGDVLVTVNKASAPGSSASAPTPDASSRHRDVDGNNGGAGAAVRDGDGGSGSNKRVGISAREERWVMVGKGGKPQRFDEAGQDWQETGRGHDAQGTTGRKRVMQPRQVGASRGWESIRGRRTDDSCRQSAANAEDWSLHEGSWPALGCSGSVSSEAGVGMPGTSEDGNGIVSIVPSRPRGSSFGGARPPEPAGFWRAFQWELAGMRLMLGSSLQVCSTSGHPHVSVRLHDGDEELSLCTCLDYYLDNVMENVPELALCMREKGYIQGCRLVSTEDIPYLGSTATGAAGGVQGAGGVGVGSRAAPLFDPVVVELNATILLRFLQDNCSREGGTYLLHRSKGAAHVQLYDVSALSRQRNRRWKWLLAMLCYRFALRISHHTRQPWCRGGRAAGSHGTSADAGPAPGPEMVHQLQRRQRQLLENTLELLEELAQLGGGGHETICASVQEHIADTYLGYGGSHLNNDGAEYGDQNRVKDNVRQHSIARGTGAANGTGSGGNNTSAIAAGATTGTTRPVRAPWRIDPDGGVWTSPQAKPPAARANGNGTSKKTGKRRESGVSRMPEADRVPNRGEWHGDGDGNGGSVGWDADGGVVGGFQTEDDLDKAQDHLTSGIAILRGVMARQESSAAGRDDDSAGDVVIVGESRLPVAVMRRPSPWLAVDDTDDEEDVSKYCDKKYGANNANGHGGGRDRKEIGAAESSLPSRNTSTRRSRRGSFDESEDPATAISVVSEQLWGLQQKLVGTYMAVARARLGRGFPAQFPPDTPLDTAPHAGGSGRRKVAVGGGGRGKNGAQSRARGSGDLDLDGPDEETRVELAAGALDALCAAWEHLTEAVVTLDRRAAGVLACEEAEKDGRGGDSEYTNGLTEAAARMKKDTNPDAVQNVHSHEHLAREGAVPTSLRSRVEEGLGPLWAGSLSEALARSGGDAAEANGAADDSASDEGGSGLVDMATASKTGGGFGAVDGGRISDRSNAPKKSDLTGGLTWDRAARRQLDARRAELFELCGDVAHACFSLRTVAATAASGAIAASPPIPKCHLIERLLPRLEGLLSCARPSLVLGDLDVCRGLHGHVLETLSGRKSSREIAHDTQDPPSLRNMCVHFLAKHGDVPGDSTAWSLCLAAEACYEQALLDLAVCGGAGVGPAGDSLMAAAAADNLAVLTAFNGRVRNNHKSWSGGRPPRWDAIGDLDGTAALAVEARARLRRKVGDASNELGKLLSQCAGVLVRAPPPESKPQPPSTAASPISPGRVITTAASSSPTTELSQPHPGLASAVCVACAEGRFRRSLEEFKAIDDARNTALLLCNLASVERLKTRVLARLCEVYPEIGAREVTQRGEEGSGGEVTGSSGKRNSGGSNRRPEGAQAAIELCGQAHAALGRREADPHTWDHASGELAMAYLCLGVDRRQELLASLVRPEHAVGTSETAGINGRAAVAPPTFSAPPSAIQGRGVVEPLEQALQIYTDMQNAPQAAACHYQIGQYYAKVFPAYRSRGSGGADASSVPFPSADASPSNSNAGSTLRSLKAWEVGQRAARHFLAARAYFATFEHGPTSVILALDLCDLYLALAGVGIGRSAAGASSGGEWGRSGVGGEAKDSVGNVSTSNGTLTLPVPIPSEREDPKGEAASGLPVASHPRPAAAMRCRCLEGALRSLLETRSVFARAGVDKMPAAAGASGDVKGGENMHGGRGSALSSPGSMRLLRLLEGVLERLPKVMQALVRASVEAEKQLSLGEVGMRGQMNASGAASGAKGGGDTNHSALQLNRSATFKSMYRRSLVGSRGGGGDGREGAQAVLDGMAADYAGVNGGGWHEE